MVFGKLLPDTFYQSYSHDGGLTCAGADCFLNSHIFQIEFNALALVLVVVVAHKTFALYQVQVKQ